MIVCSACYDKQDPEKFTAIVPQATCADCGKMCLGYVIDGELLLPCECGCGTLTPGGRIESAHPEDYRFGERGC